MSDRPKPVATWLAFTPDARWLLVGTDQGLDIVRSHDLALARRWLAPDTTPRWRQAALAPDGRWLALTEWGDPLVAFDLADVQVFAPAPEVAESTGLPYRGARRLPAAARAARSPALDWPAVIDLALNGLARRVAPTVRARTLFFDQSGALWSEGAAGVFRVFLPEGREERIHRRPSDLGIVWDACPLPRWRRTLYALEGRGLLWPWDPRPSSSRTPGPVELADWLRQSSLTLRGGTIFGVRANAHQTLLAFGGKHPDVTLVRIQETSEPVSVVACAGDARNLVTALHPTLPLGAACDFDGHLTVFETEQGFTDRSTRDGTAPYRSGGYPFE